MSQMKNKSPYFQFIIINQFGLLHYSQKHDSFVSPMKDSNELIQIVSSFYSLDNLQSTIVPQKAKTIYQTSDIDFLNKSRIQDIQTSTFRFSVFQSVTGFRFILTTSPEINSKTNHTLLQLIYKSFTDYVLKDPFYSSDQPLQNQQFTDEVNKILDK